MHRYEVIKWGIPPKGHSEGTVCLIAHAPQNQSKTNWPPDFHIRYALKYV